MKARKTRRESAFRRSLMNTSWLSAVAVLIILSTTLTARAQTFRGSIVGTITDQSQAPIPNAKVTVKNQATGLTRATVSGDAGQYSVSELPVGAYTVTVEKDGFGTVTEADVAVNVASERRVDVQLVPAKLEQSVEVHAEVTQVATTEDTVSGTLV